MKVKSNKRTRMMLATQHMLMIHEQNYSQHECSHLTGYAHGYARLCAQENDMDEQVQDMTTVSRLQITCDIERGSDAHFGAIIARDERKHLFYEGP
jgi:hypothetical protein